MQNNPEFARTTLKIDKITFLRSPSDPNRHMEIQAKGGHMRRIITLVKTMSGHNFHRNNAHNRKLWAQHIISFWNHPNTQRMFKYPEPLSFGSDITPMDETRSLPMSEYLTIRDTMDYIVQSYSKFKSIADVLRDERYLPYYYSAAVIPAVHQHFAPLLPPAGHNGGAAQNQLRDADGNPFPHLARLDF